MNILSVFDKFTACQIQAFTNKALRFSKTLGAFGVIPLLAMLILTACRSASPAPVAAPPAESLPSAQLDPSIPAAILPRPSVSPSPSVASPSPPDGVVTLGLVGRPQSLNPLLENNPALRELSPLLFETLLQVDPQTAELQPGLAQSWEYTNQGQRVVFHLPAGLKWSNGHSLTAADLVAGLEATQHPALLAFSHLNAPDDETLALTFIDLDCAAVTALAQLPLLPPAEITATIPTGSGPFIVADRSENRRTLTLAANPHYHGSRPGLDKLAIRFLQADEIPVALSEGQFDLLGPIQPVLANPPLDIDPSQFTIHHYPAPQVVYIALNFAPHNGDPLAPEIRQALLLALDREAILRESLGDNGQLLAASLLPGHWAANEALPPPPYDLAAARALLTEAGLRDNDGDGWLDRRGQRLELSIRLNGKNPLHQNLGWLVSSYYRDLGLFARAESVPFDSIVDDLFTHDFDLALFSWPILPDPDQRLYWYSTENTEGIGLNFTSYHNPELDGLIDAGRAVPGCRPQDRAGIYADIQQILARDRPVDFLLAPRKQVLVGSRLHGVRSGPFAPFTWNVTDWWLE
ncbi:MAG: peptide ABC transporter substrate-binding protein [Anaerolineae bacterium]|nr:peptide ABC transporter substrate-binding protein [Anaerolineae bacterium]